MTFLRQTWILTKKDLLLVARRSWFTTSIRALLLPIVFTAVFSYVRIWIAAKAKYGIGEPTPVPSLPEAFEIAGSSRTRLVIVDHGLEGNDIKSVIDQLSQTFHDANKEVYVSHDPSAFAKYCPSSSHGYTTCFGGIEFHSSPHEGLGWRYTLYQDGAISKQIDIESTMNPVQVCTLPLQHAIDAAIASTKDGPKLPDKVLQYPFSILHEEEVKRDSQSYFEWLVEEFIGFAFFIGLCGIAYHLPGHVTRQREQGMLHLIDVMMPNEKRWQCIAARNLSVYIAFTAIYAPSWIIMGAVASVLAFPQTNPGLLILFYILGGLALVGYSIFVSNFFRHAQLSAISSILAAMVFTLVAQFAEGRLVGATSAGVLATAVLFPPSAFVYFIIDTAAFEARIKGLDIIGSTPNHYWSFPVITFLGCLIFQILFYPLMGMVLEKWLHGNSSKSRHLLSTSEMGGNAIRLTAFSKQYNKSSKKSDRIKAVNDLTLNVHAGSITVLLGSNGSGKTTTLKAIAGLESVTDGTIELDGTGGIGLCPQQDVMWDNMTVREHVNFFQRLKSPSLPLSHNASEIDELISDCDLKVKTNARAKTLSGGQKRKLQLAMMLAGGSRVCCIDEASSGIDPLARRKVWDILLRERGRRTMLLTTHFLDESEVLADYVAILSKGVLKAEGSVASLKTRHGSGYRLALPNGSDGFEPQILPRGVSHHGDYNETVYDVPDTSTLANLIETLERAGTTDCRIHGPTIEDVFLNLAEEMRTATKTDSELMLHESGDRTLTTQHRLAPALAPIKLRTGKGCGPIKQTAVLFLKRLTILKHNFMPYIAALFVPLVLAGMVTRFLIGTYPDGLPCRQSTGGHGWDTKPTRLTLDEFAYGPPSAVSRSKLSSLIPGGSSRVEWKHTLQISSLWELNATVAAVVAKGESYDKSGGAGIYLDESSPRFVFEAEPWDALSEAVFAQSTLDMAVTDTSIDFAYAFFAPPFSPNSFKQGLLVVFMVLGFAVYPGFFALYPTAERLSNVRAMHYSNGIKSSSLWAAYALFDLIFILLVSILATVIWATQYGGWYGLPWVCVIFVLYGLAGTAYSYVVSLFVPSQLAALAATSLLQTLIAMAFFLGYIGTIETALTADLSSWFSQIYYTIGILCPAVSLFRALLITLNVYSLACEGEELASYPGAMDRYGAPILYLVVQFILLVAFLMFWESGRSLEIFGIHLARGKRTKLSKHHEQDHHDMMEDEKHMDSSNDGLRIENVSKSFRKVRAVNNITFGILPSEKFALLGPNGAGKSTLISLIRGDLYPDKRHPAASIFISNENLMQSPLAAKNNLGVCPQQDACDLMTLKEHLHFYARARGVPEKDTNVDELISRLGLTDHAYKLARKLSGGTRRKLSLAIALISNPSVLLLDEPSSGMDAAAKRALWSTLSTVSAGRSLLITTHSMEEADALCDRAGIMASKMLALGSIPQLRAQHGNNLYIHLVHKDAPYTSDADAEMLWSWISSTFLVADAERKIFGGQIRFSVPIGHQPNSDSGLLGGADIGRLFRVIEGGKGERGIQDYSIGPTTLDQVFLNVVRQHNIAEENTD